MAAAAAGGGPTPAAGTTPVTPGASPIPLASGDYASAAAMANTAYQQALAQINSQRQSALQQYGYTGTIDPTTGTLTNMQVDPNNPFGQYQQMLSGGASDLAATEADNMARGLGATIGARGGGLGAQGFTADKLGFGANSANLGQSLMDTLGSLQGQQTGAQETMDNALWQAELDAAQGAIQSQAFDPANMSGITDAPIKGGEVPGAQTTIQPASAKGAVGGKVPNPNQSKGVRIRAARNNAARQAAARHTAARRPRRRR